MNGDCAKRAIFARVEDLLHRLKMEYNAEFQAVLFTALGKIVCDIEPFTKESSPIGVTDDPSLLTLDISAVFEEQDVFGARLINAKNVTVYNGDSDEVIARAEQMILFADHILGFTLVRTQL